MPMVPLPPNTGIAAQAAEGTAWATEDEVLTYKTILADPPWELSMAGARKRAKEAVKPEALAYPTMTTDAICALGVGDLADDDCHLWLWTTNQHLEDGFKVMRAWGFKYLAPIHWLKPSGQGNWFIHRTQTILFGYRQRCMFSMARYVPNFFKTGDPKRHSQKPEESFALIESISPGPRLELFARQNRPGWDAWGNECLSTDLLGVS
jgi:N6-adenosine-specific RNA methylase IME4